jgi:NDP-mannose synthase
LAPYTTVLPKPLMPVGDAPILEILIGSLVAAGVTRITLAVGHLATLIMAYVGDGSRFGAEIDYSVEESPLGTAGPLRLIDGLDGAFLVVNGDLLTDLDFTAMLEQHRTAAAVATVGVYRRSVKIDLGVVEGDDTGRITRYVEKPVQSLLVSMGVYVLEPDVLTLIPAGPFDLPDLVASLLHSGMVVRGFEHPGYWLDIGRPDDYERAQRDAPIIGRRRPGDEASMTE